MARELIMRGINVSREISSHLLGLEDGGQGR